MMDNKNVTPSSIAGSSHDPANAKTSLSVQPPQPPKSTDFRKNQCFFFFADGVFLIVTSLKFAEAAI